MLRLNTRQAHLEYAAPNIPPYLIAFLVQLAAQRGWKCESWFSGLGISPAQCLEPGARLSFRQAAVIVRRAVVATREPALGLQVGSRESISSCGVVGLAMMSAPTFGAALALISRFHRLTGSLVNQTVEIQGHRAALVAVERFPESDLLPFLCEELFACALRISQALLGSTAQPLSVELAYAPTTAAPLYRRSFNCSVEFNAPLSRLWFDAELLDVRLDTADPTTHATAVQWCESQLGNACEPVDHVSALELWLATRTGGSIRITDAAHALNMSERTLRRRLAEAGYRFKDLHDRVRARQALRLLDNLQAPVADIADQLGFSDGREFRRAFKRWTGASPSSARAGELKMTGLRSDTALDGLGHA